jgi:hypothetical protein
VFLFSLSLLILDLQAGAVLEEILLHGRLTKDKAYELANTVRIVGRMGAEFEETDMSQEDETRRPS